MIGFRPPQTQTEVITPATEGAGAYAVFMYCLRADGWRVGAALCIVYLSAYTIVALAYLNGGPRLPWPPWWLAWIPESIRMLGLVLGTAWGRCWPWFLSFLPAWIVVWLAGVITHAKMLIRYRYRIEFVDRNWPPVYPQRDPATAGATWYDMQRAYRAGAMPAQQPAGAWNVTAKLEEGRTNVYLEFMIEPESAGHWYRYCRAWQDQQKPAWSISGFRAFHLGRDEYGNINGAFLARGGVVVTQTYKDGRVEYEPNARGRAFLRAFATTPPPKE